MDDIKTWLPIATTVLGWKTSQNVYINLKQKSFGEFITIKRSNGDIHGCMGWFNNGFREASINDLQTHLLKSAYEASFVDPRKNNFNTELLTDVDALIEISYLQLPLIPANNENFNNNDKGLLVEVIDDNNVSHYATFLPKVFINSSWDNISKQLINKAYRGNFKSVSFSYYTTQNIEFPLSKIVSSEGFQYYWLEEVCLPWLNFSNTHVNNIPCYTYKNTCSYEYDEIVRNLAVIETMLKLSKYDKVNNFDNYILDIIKSELKPNQVALLYIILTKYYTYNTDKLYNFLVNSLNNWKDLEPKFELGQVIIALSLKPIDKIKEVIQTWCNYTNNSIDKDDVFWINWHIQAIYASSVKLCTNTIQLLEHNLINFIFIMYNRNIVYETNYLAVMLESLVYFRLILPNINTKEVNQCIMIILNLLDKRFNSEVYNFLDGSARLDISSHIINAMLKF